MKTLLSLITSSLVLSTSLPSFAQDGAYFRINPPVKMISSSSGDGVKESIYVDIRVNPGSWRENETVNFPINVYPYGNYNISANGLPGTIEYNSGLKSFVGNSSAGNSPYNHPFDVTVSGTGFSQKKTFELSIYPELSVSSNTNYSARVGTPFTSDIPTSEGVVGSSIWRMDTTIPGLAISSSNGVISGTPTKPGLFEGVVISVTDSIDGKSASTDGVRIQVDAPLINISAASLDIRSPTLVNIPIAVSGGFEDLSVSVTGLPNGVSYNEQIGNISGTAAPGSYPLTITAGNEWSSETRDINLVVHQPMAATLANSNFDVFYGQDSNLSIASSSTIVGSAIWSLSSGALPPGMSVIGNGRVSGTPNQIGTFTGSLSVTDTYDGLSANTSNFNINVTYQPIQKTIASGTNINLRTLFTDAEWASPAPKTAIINHGTVVGSTTSTAALISGSGWNGTLTLRNEGEIQGSGGAINSGTGGDAILSQDSRFIIENHGAIRAGGGGGGQGGKGGNGTYSAVQREPSSGYSRGNGYSYLYYESSGNSSRYYGSIYWAGSRILDIGFDSLSQWPSVYSSGGWTYYSDGNGGGVARQRSVTETSIGGNGGSGSLGVGYNNSSVASGSPGVSGVNGAGAGGSGGSGGNWGSSGTSGSNGVSGTASSGLSGSTGGLAGMAINGSAAVTGSGIIQGR